MKYLLIFIICYVIFNVNDRVASEKGVIRDTPSFTYQNSEKILSEVFMTNQKEIFKDIPGYEGIYQVNSSGQVKSLSRKLFNGSGYFFSKEIVLKSYKTKSNYIFYYLKNKNKKRKSEFCHRLVLRAFKGDSKLECNHKDGVPWNNNLSNLEYVTSKENKRHAWATGLCSDKTRQKMRDARKRIAERNKIEGKKFRHKKFICLHCGKEFTTIFACKSYIPKFCGRDCSRFQHKYIKEKQSVK